MRIILILILFFSCSNHDIDKSYYENGKIRYAIGKKNNQIHGVANYWDDNGRLINTVEYSHGQIHGKWIKYYKSEKIKAVTYYKFGNN